MVSFINALDYPNFPASRPLLRTVIAAAKRGAEFAPGNYAFAWSRGEEVFLARDPLGCDKLFYGRAASGSVIAANRIDRALELGVALDDLASCPPGHLIRVDAHGAEVIGGRDLSSLDDTTEFSIAKFKDEVRDTLERAMEQIASTWREATFAVCLSGGIDSSAVAALAKKHLPNVVAFSFSYISENDAVAWLRGSSPSTLKSVSEDFSAAGVVARALDIPLVPVFRPIEAVAPTVPLAIRLCQDWRDFNVHCAVVNVFLAQDIRAHFASQPVVALTGDLMNEFVCDYQQEEIDGVAYYPQPRVPLAKRRRFFVRGLDAGDREFGVFNAYGVPVVQIYATVAEHYLRVPVSLLAEKDAKMRLNGHLLPSSVRDVVGSAKRRAQVGGKDGGTLGAFHRSKINQEDLLGLWVKSLPPAGRGAHPEDIIQFGRYRNLPRHR